MCDCEYLNDGDMSSKEPAMIQEKITFCKHIYKGIWSMTGVSILHWIFLALIKFERFLAENILIDFLVSEKKIFYVALVARKH